MYAIVSSWDTSRVTNTAWMFSYASAFNGDLSHWNTGRVTSMYGMFPSAFLMKETGTVYQNAFAFNRDLSTWNVLLCGELQSQDKGSFCER